MTSSRDRQTPFTELTEEQRRRVTNHLAALLPSEDPESYWNRMSSEHQYELLWSYEQQSSGLPTDAETQAAFDQLGEEAFEESPVDEQLAYTRLLGRVLDPGQVKALPDPEWLIQGLLVKNTLALLWGEWNSMKTFLALTWAGYIGSGSHWLHRPVHKCQVLYVAGEGVAGLKARVAAFENGHMIYGMPGVEFHHGRINLLDRVEMAALERLVRQRGYELIVWDTIARMMPGADENSAKDVSAMVDTLENLRLTGGCGSLVLHHGTKDGGSARGMSPLLGACDTELKTVADGQHLTLKCLQQRDAERADDISLWRELVANTGSATIVDGIGKIPVGRSPLEQRILDELRNNPLIPYTRVDMSCSVTCSDSAANKVLFSLFKEGICSRVRRGSGWEYMLVRP
jgi:hypothetical protein